MEGVLTGSHVSVIKIDAETSKRLGLLATETVSVDGWMGLTEPLIVKAGEGFIAVPVTHHLRVLADTFAVCRLDGNAPSLPGRAQAASSRSHAR